MDSAAMGIFRPRARIEPGWPRRAVFIFAGSLIVLSVFLAVFAIREAQRERLLRERNDADDERRIADVIAGQAKIQLGDFEQRIGAQLGLAGEYSSTDKSAGIAEEIIKNEDLAADVFFIDIEGNLVFPNSRPLYNLPRAENPVREVPAENEKNELFKQAESAEFRSGQYTEAISLYRRLAGEITDRGFRAFILSRIARCYEKAGNHAGAVESYRSVLETGSPDLTSEGIPLAVTAWYQIATISSDGGRSLDAAEALLKLKEGLFGALWPLTKSRFEFYAKKTDELFASIVGELKSTAKGKEILEGWNRLGEWEDDRKAFMRKLGVLSEQIVPQIESKRVVPRGDPSGFFRISALTEAGVLLVSYKRFPAGMIIGIIIDPIKLAGKLTSIDPSILRLREGWHVQVSDGNGRVVAGDDFSSWTSPRPKQVFSRTFDDGFPPWTIRILQSNINTPRRQFLVRGGIYVLSAAVVIAALFLGGMMAIKSTAKELRLAELKSDFVSTVSHEFRTPLMSIRYLAELLQRGRVRDEERKRQYYETITSESERLGRLIENILDFSKIEAGLKKYETEAVDIAALVEDVASGFERQAAPKKIDLEMKIETGIPSIPGDRDALSRALFNLLDNAVKYSGDSPRVHLRAWFRLESVFLEVEDHGIGISRDDQKKVFEKFFRSDRAMRGNVKGSGIGLTLVAHIVKAHGGNVKLESEVGRGTKVTIELSRRPLGAKGEI
jgi:signal transduction histidine kinase